MNIVTLDHAISCIDHTGTVDIHLAIERGIPEALLAEAKFKFFLSTSGTDAISCQDHLKRLLVNNERSEESRICWTNEEMGSPKGQYYHYRHTYYGELVQRHRNYLVGVLVQGFQAQENK